MTENQSAIDGKGTYLDVASDRDNTRKRGAANKNHQFEDEVGICHPRNEAREGSDLRKGKGGKVDERREVQTTKAGTEQHRKKDDSVRAGGEWEKKKGGGLSQV